jgi:flagellar biosynthesis protein FlhB
LAVFALPVASVAICSIFSRLLENSSTNIGSVTKRRRHVAVSEVVVNTLLALCVFVAVMSVPDVLVQRFLTID